MTTDQSTDRPRRELQAVLRAGSTRSLLQSIIRLTHTIDRTRNTALANEFRTQRGIVMDEVERRTTVHDMALPDPRLPGLTHVSLARIEREEVERRG